ncbi:CPBP family intramembrane glutamic endopeptidase [Jannaschia sp. CCS1]|uniref:CPBP family intramembrane glutamic endopeptidase n=1 Tax=Jannaschia sp. (strain CCS1) TaxID=290400 RepID=UPI000053B97C|nr:CPBP family intramembrane glutamic endopeptidase [Jannaschia sp. CCS1]ABD55056.1 Abortive infection protein [Jannaschia sp. CCS1]
MTSSDIKTLAICVALVAALALLPDATLYLALIAFSVMLVLPKGRAFLKTLGFRQQDNWLKTIGLAVAGWAAVMAVQTIVANLFPNVFLQEGGGVFADVEGNTPLFLYSVLSGIVIGGFVEEMLFRGYLLTRLIRIFGDNKATTFAIVLATSLIFAFIHVYQGAAAVVLTGIFSFVVGLIFVRTNYNLWLVILIHSLFNIVTFTTLYLGIA